MRTAVVSDLHLGTTLGSDLARRPEPRHALLSAVADADRVVLLGDVLELRQGPVAAALEAARPFLEELGRAFEGRRVVIVPGNHDQQLVSAMLDRARVTGERLGLERVVEPAAAGPLAERVAECLRPASLELAYPGLWLRDDVYATHGHYLDAHLTIPRVECLAAGVVQKLVGPLPAGRATPGDYERILGPVYALAYSLAQGSSPKRGLAATQLSTRVWKRLDRTSSRDLGARVLGGVVLPAIVAGLNRAGLGPFTANLTGEELRRSGLASMGEVVGRLGIEADHVLFGHTHRPGPLHGDEGFAVPGGPRLVNTGSWIREGALAGQDLDRSPYRPGVVCRLEETGPPRLENVLDSAVLARTA
ncbi:MAG: metallophosphoesterase [Thermoleophilaceae bacterium]|nr:metallophosphoesterase family protein [Thermoleophilaceae bacterium]MBA3838985.1 metallophosphoesterase family protein [Thermoleophilaceae bacterium]